MKNWAKKFLNYVKALPFAGVLMGIVHFSFGQELEVGKSAASNLKWNHISSTGKHNDNLNGVTIGLTLNKKIYTWGANTYKEIYNGPFNVSTPFYVPTPAGEMAKKVFAMELSAAATNTSQRVFGNAFACLTESGKVYGWGVNNGCFGNTWVITTSNIVDTNSVKRVPTLITIPNETNIVDMAVPNTGGWLVVVASSGKAYFNGPFGGVASGGSQLGFTNFPQIPNPAGVNSTTFKYINVWVATQAGNGGMPPLVYLKGNDNKIYVTGQLSGNLWGAGSPAAVTINQTGGHDVWNIGTKIPTEVTFPAGEDVVKIAASDYVGSATTPMGDFAVALTASGKVFAGGAWRYGAFSTNNPYNDFYIFPVKVAPTGTLVKQIVLSDTISYLPTFSEVPLPTGVGATKFIDVTIPNGEEKPIVSIYYVTDNNYVFWSGKNHSLHETLQNFLVNDSSTPDCSSNFLFSSTSGTALNVEAVNLWGAAKLFPTLKSTFLVTPSGKGYVFGTGSVQPYTGLGRRNGVSHNYSAPLAISNELLDTCNPRPGNGDGGGTSTASPAVGTINCSKTQIVAAPVSGTPSQHALVVTVNVTTAGSFSPLSVSGSGMSLANGVTSVTTALTGVQQLQIPINYDGTALTNNFQFTIGQAGSCTADLTLQSNPVLKNVYTLQNCMAITPGILSK